jgi:hypothetical protein
MSLSPAIRSMFKRGGKCCLIGDLFLETETLHWTNWGEAFRYTCPVTGNSVVYTPAPFTLMDSKISKDTKETSVITIRLNVCGHSEYQDLSIGQLEKLQQAMSKLDEYLERNDVRGSLAVLRAVNPNDLTDHKHQFTGIVDRFELDNGGLVLELAEPNDILSASGYPVSTKCHYIFGDTRCGVDRESSANKYIGATETGSDDTTILDSSISPSTANYWDFAVVKMTSGENKGGSRGIRTYDNATGTLTVDIPFQFDVASGDAFELRRRCKKTYTHCQVLNAVPHRFGGCPYVNEPVQGLFWRGKG